ncbi:MAG TPA: type II toxin-antitoxin system Phd/YefM family antitoxin [Polyangia bacterium]|jgi:prevent-host-death family protein
MATKDRTIPAGEFKARCLALLDEVARTGRAVRVTKRGRPVARVVPLEEHEPASLRGSVLHETDLVSPVEADWDATT